MNKESSDKRAERMSKTEREEKKFLMLLKLPESLMKYS
jgi:hypothetical protein